MHIGDNFLKYINSEGRVIIDLMKVIQSGPSLDTYKLDFVSLNLFSSKIVIEICLSVVSSDIHS